jgi:hypothetical protein
VIDREHFEKLLRKQEELTPEDRRHLKDALRQDWLLRLLGLAQSEIDGQTRQLKVASLSTEEGVRDTVHQQGKVTGMERVIELMLEEADKEENE